MTIVGAFEAKTHFSALLDKVEQGEEVVITRHGKAVARLVSEKIIRKSDQDNLAARFKAVRANATLGGIDWRELRDAGRK
jgi:prevent-host-death family protein